MTRFCFDELIKMMADSKYEYSVLCVISESSYIPICDSYGFNWVYAENDPLGAKINTGISRALEFTDWDYIMMMNSDNVIRHELIDDCYQQCFDERAKFFGVSKVTYVNFYTREAREIEYGQSVIGVAKFLRRDVVEALGGALYRPHLNKCLDDTMLDNVVAIGVGPRIVRYDGMLAMDFKSETNIWPWEEFSSKGKEVAYVAV